MTPAQNAAAKLHNLESEVRYLAHLLGVEGDWRTFTADDLRWTGIEHVQTLAGVLARAAIERQRGDLATITRFLQTAQAGSNKIYATANF